MINQFVNVANMTMFDNTAQFRPLHKEVIPQRIFVIVFLISACKIIEYLMIGNPCFQKVFILFGNFQQPKQVGYNVQYMFFSHAVIRRGDRIIVKMFTV